MKFINDVTLNYLVQKIDKVKHFWNNEERDNYKDRSNKESLDVLFKSNDTKLARNNTMIARSLMIGDGKNQKLDVRSNDIKFFRNLGENGYPIMKLTSSDDEYIELHNAGISLKYRTLIKDREIKTYYTNSIVLGRQNTINNTDYYCGLKPNNNFTLMLSPKFYKAEGSFMRGNEPCITLISSQYSDKGIHLYPLGTNYYPYMELNGTSGNISIKAENLIDIDSDSSIDIGQEDAEVITIGNFSTNNGGICVDKSSPKISIRSEEINIYTNSGYNKLRLDAFGGIISLGWNANKVTIGCNLEMNQSSIIRTNNLFLKNKIDRHYTDNSLNHFIDYGLLDNLYRLAYIVKENFSYNRLSITLQHIKEINTQGVWNNNVYTYNGVTFTVNDDLTITATGTSTSNNCRIWIYNGLFSQPTGYNLYATGCPRGGAQNKFYLNAYTMENGEDWDDVMDYGNKDDDCLLNGNNRINSLRILFNINSGVEVKNLIIAPMLVEKDEYRHLPYQQYGAVNNGLQSQIDTLINQLNNLS